MIVIGSNRQSRHLTTLLHKFGVWFTDDNSVYYKYYAIALQFVFSFGYTVSLSGAVFESGDFQEATVSIPLSLSCIIICARIANFYVNNGSMQARLREIHTFELWNHDEQLFIRLRLKGFNKLSFAFTVTIYFCLCTQLIVPLFLTKATLPLPIWFPLNWRHNKVHFWIVYTYSSMAIVVIGHMVMLLQIFTCYLMYMNTLKFEILGLRFSRLGFRQYLEPDRSDDGSSRGNYGTVNGRLEYPFLTDVITCTLIGCVKCHRRIVGNIRRIEKNLSGIFLLQISCSSVVICSGAYILAFSPPKDNQVQIIVHIALIGYYIFDIFLTMYFGNLIILKSDALGLALYESNWIQQSLGFRRIAMILFENLREPTTIRVGKLFPLNLQTFSSVIFVFFLEKLFGLPHSNILATAYRLFSVFANMEGIQM